MSDYYLTFEQYRSGVKGRQLGLACLWNGQWVCFQAKPLEKATIRVTFLCHSSMTLLAWHEVTARMTSRLDPAACSQSECLNTARPYSLKFWSNPKTLIKVCNGHRVNDGSLNFVRSGRWCEIISFYSELRQRPRPILDGDGVSLIVAIRRGLVYREANKFLAYCSTIRAREANRNACAPVIYEPQMYE